VEKGILADHGRILLEGENLFLTDRTYLQIRKPLNFSLEVRLEEWDDDMFCRFI